MRKSLKLLIVFASKMYLYTLPHQPILPSETQKGTFPHVVDRRDLHVPLVVRSETVTSLGDFVPMTVSSRD